MVQSYPTRRPWVDWLTGLEITPENQPAIDKANAEHKAAEIRNASLPQAKAQAEAGEWDRIRNAALSKTKFAAAPPRPAPMSAIQTWQAEMLARKNKGMSLRDAMSDLVKTHPTIHRQYIQESQK